MNDGKEELDELREAVRDFLAAKAPEGAVRAAVDWTSHCSLTVRRRLEQPVLGGG